MPPNKEDLIAIVRRYYESSDAFLVTGERSPETKRRQETWTRWIANMAPWRAFKASLKGALPSYSLGETFPSDDGGPRCMVYPPKGSWLPESNWDIVGCISLLAPVYFVYGVEWDYIDGRGQNFRARFEQPPPTIVLPTQIVAATIEKCFGFSALPRELTETPVHLYAGLMEPPQTTLFHTLFTNDPANIP